MRSLFVSALCSPHGYRYSSFDLVAGNNVTRWILDNLILFSGIVIALVIAFDLVLVRVSHSESHENTWRASMATVGTQLTALILISVLINNLFSLKRERDQRVWTARKEHL